MPSSVRRRLKGGSQLYLNCNSPQGAPQSPKTAGGLLSHLQTCTDISVGWRLLGLVVYGHYSSPVAPGNPPEPAYFAASSVQLLGFSCWVGWLPCLFSFPVFGMVVHMTLFSYHIDIRDPGHCGQGECKTAFVSYLPSPLFLAIFLLVATQNRGSKCSQLTLRFLEPCDI